MNFPRQRFAFSVAELAPSLLNGTYNCGNVAVASPPHRVADERQPTAVFPATDEPPQFWTSAVRVRGPAGVAVARQRMAAFASTQ